MTKTFILGAVSLMIPASLAFAEASDLRLAPDYDRDGRIDDADLRRAIANEQFTIWLNDDDDDEGAKSDEGKGDTNVDLHDVPGGEGNDRDCEDEKVNGRCDLLDFFPVLIDVGGVADWQSYAWKLCSKSVNVVFTGLDAAHAGDFHTKESKALDGETPLYRATVGKLAGEDGEASELPDGFLKDGRGVIIVEGAAPGNEGLTLRGEKEGCAPVEATLDLRVKNVEEMYGWMNLRDAAKDQGEGEQWDAENPAVRLSPSPSPDSRHFILVHGYNTNHEEARGNAAEFYKKLWQAGSDALFTAVEWRGDQSQMRFDLLGITFSPNYHVNVENAFAAARPFADACKKLPGEKILVGHSLGNMLIASAIKDYGLDYTTYVMLNAAVAREAFDANAYDEDMVSVLWRDAGEAKAGGDEGDPLTDHLDRASRWYRNFAGKEYDPYEYRRKLAWRGRFANLPRTVNYYSPTDNVLANPANPDLNDLKGADGESAEKVRPLLEKTFSVGGIWALSEKLKGRPTLIDTVNGVLTNVFGMAESDVYKCEGGWGKNDDYEEGVPFSPANTHFTPFLDPRLKTQGMLDILPAETERLRAQHLADAIPAESFAAGANPVVTLENVNLEDFIGENPDWPVREEVKEKGEGEGRKNEWKHSTFREVAYYHTSGLYASLAAVGKQRVILDTDLGSSMDDLFAVDLAARMHKSGKLDLMAVMMDRSDGSNPSDDPHGRGEFLTFADRYLATLGLGDLPIGKSEALMEDQPVFNPYWTLIYSNNVTGVGLLLPTNRSPEQIDSLSSAVALYRRLLKGAPDRSVVICSTGFLSNLKALMESEGDEISELTGMELLGRKVKELRIMAGCFDYTVAPDGKGGAEYNAAGDPVAAKKVFEEWPTPVVVSPWEVGLKLDYKPKDVLADFPAGTFDPVIRAAYVYWSEPVRQGDLNRLWDVMTALPLTEGETLAPLSPTGTITVDGIGKTTFVPDRAGTRRYQMSSNMNAAAVMNRYRAICRTGNPFVTVVPISLAEPGVDYNGSVLSVKIDGFGPGSFYRKEDLFATLTVAGETYENPVWTGYEELSGILTLEFTVPPDKVTAGLAYEGEVKVGFRNASLGTNVVYARKREFFVQGRQEEVGPGTDWFNETDLEMPTDYVPATAMPERCRATVETTVLFTGQTFVVEYRTATNAVQGAVRIVPDGADGYKFQYYACVGKTNEDSFVRGWWDFNFAGEDAEELKPASGVSYTVCAVAHYFEDARRQENTLVISAKATNDNMAPKTQFIGNLVNERGEQGGTTRLNSVGLLGAGTASLVGNYYTNSVNANLARVGADEVVGDIQEYPTVAAAVEAAREGQTVRLLHAASWKPTSADIGKPVRFLNKSCLNLDLSGLPANARAVWTDVDGNDGTLTMMLVYADAVVYGTIRTAEEGQTLAEAIAIKDGKYVYVGDETGAAMWIKNDVTEVVDHRGKGMVMPGCTDGHSHYLNTFAMNNMKGGLLFDLTDDKVAVLQKLEEAALAAQKAKKTSLCGFGWNSQIILTNKLSLADLDKVTHEVSTVIYDSSGHHAFCNSECLKRCKIISEDGKTVLIKEIDGGLLELDDDYPTGYVNERATGYLTRMGGIDADELIDDKVAEVAIRKSQELLLSTGYTTALDAWSNNLHPRKFYEIANRTDASGDLKIVLAMTYEVEPWQANMTSEIDGLVSLKETYWTRHVRPEYLKVFMDGVVEARTGATITPYKKDETHPEGFYYQSFWPTSRLAEITKACNEKGLTVHTHAMGDAAIKETADAYIKANELRADNTYRNCLVHLRNVRNEDFQRFADNNIACVAGLTWHTANTDFDKTLSQFLCDEYVYHAYPLKSFFDAGVRVSGHSDYPANRPSPQDPFGMMHVAVNGMVPDPGKHDYPHDANELITVEQAFRALTLNGAWQLGLENERGSIKVGKWADFVLADQDVFECKKTDIGKTKVVATWFEGEEVYRAAEPEPGIDGGAVTYPKANVSTGLVKAPSTATWKAKAYPNFVFAGWRWANETPCEAFDALTENERRDATLKLQVGEGEQVRPTDVKATWAVISEDGFATGPLLTSDGRLVAGCRSYVKATVSGLPSGLAFDKKTLAVTGAAKKSGDKAVTLSVRNASGYAEEQKYTVVVAEDFTFTVEFVPASTIVSGNPVTLWCDETLGKVKGMKVYSSTQKASISATPAKGSVFLGWYEDAALTMPATHLPKDYRVASQSGIGLFDGLDLYARFAELQPWAVGTFDGVCYETDDAANAVELGTVTFTVSSKGKVSGKTRAGGKSYSFSAKALDDAVETACDAVTFVAHPTMKVDGETKKLTLYLNENTSTGLGTAEIFYDEEEDSPFVEAVQNGWKLKPASLPAFPSGRDALTLDAPMNIGMTLKFGAKGEVTAKGTVPGDDLSAVSASAKAQVLPVAWTDEGKTNLLARTCVYVAAKRNLEAGFCEVYDLMLEADESGTKVEAVKILSPLEYSEHSISGNHPVIPRPTRPK